MKLLLLSTIACSMAAASGQDTVSVAIGEDVSDRCPEGQEWPGGSIQECRVMPGPSDGPGRERHRPLQCDDGCPPRRNCYRPNPANDFQSCNLDCIFEGRERSDRENPPEWCANGANPPQEDFASLLSSVLETVVATIGRGATSGVDTTPEGTVSVAIGENTSADLDRRCPEGQEWVEHFQECRVMPSDPDLRCSDG